MRRCLTPCLVWGAACVAPAPPSPPSDSLPAPDPSTVSEVVYLVGDAGATRREAAPLAHRLRADVEEWTARLGRDSAVTVLFLGDNVYPEGVRSREGPDFGQDSARLYAQVWAVAGANARRHGTRAIFLAGNHDWGNARAPEGLERLRNQEALLAAFAEGGTAVGLLPEAGDPGPAVVDVGEHTRIVTLDTHWWLQSRDAARKRAFTRDVTRSLRSANGRHVIVAAHHPNVSAGHHGGALRTGLDPFWLLRRAGAVVYDVNSGPYRSLLAALREAFMDGGAPLIYAAGHDHSLQLLRGSGGDQPNWTLVSGAGSKHSDVGRTDPLVWASRDAGYMRLLLLRDGRVDLYVEGVPPDHLRCDVDPEELAGCVERGVAAFTTAYTRRLR